MNSFKWMHYAYELALEAFEQGEVPVGSIVISDDNQILGSGCNAVISTSDPTAHAEIVALRAAALKINNYRLPRTTLYTTLEPCIMCAGAILNARVNRVVFAARDFAAGAAGSVLNPLKGIIIDEGYMQKESAELLKKFFVERRL